MQSNGSNKNFSKKTLAEAREQIEDLDFLAKQLASENERFNIPQINHRIGYLFTILKEYKDEVLASNESDFSMDAILINNSTGSIVTLQSRFEEILQEIKIVSALLIKKALNSSEMQDLIARKGLAIRPPLPSDKDLQHGELTPFQKRFEKLRKDFRDKAKDAEIDLVQIEKETNLALKEREMASKNVARSPVIQQHQMPEAPSREGQTIKVDVFDKVKLEEFITQNKPTLFTRFVNWMKNFFGALRFVPGPTVPPTTLTASTESNTDKPTTKFAYKLPIEVTKEPKFKFDSNNDKSIALGNLADLGTMLRNLHSHLTREKDSILHDKDKGNAERPRRDFLIDPQTGRLFTIKSEPDTKTLADAQIILNMMHDKLKKLQDDVEGVKFNAKIFQNELYNLLHDLHVLTSALNMKGFNLDRKTLNKKNSSGFQIIYIRLEFESDYTPLTDSQTNNKKGMRASEFYKDVIFDSSGNVVEKENTKDKSEVITKLTH